MIDINNLKFGYTKNQNLFDGLALNISEGNICGLLGRNGAGKSSLMKIISGLLYPKSGAVNVSGYKAQDRSPQMLQDIYFIPEEFYLPSLSIKEFAKINSVFYPNFDSSSFENLLKEFEIESNWNLKNISYGQKKKFLIAFGLASKVKLLLMDEPTNGLDIPSKRQFRRLVTNEFSDDRIFIISTHQVRDLETIIDPIVIVENGKIVMNASMFDISNKLETKKIPETEKESAIYTEELIDGYNAIVETNGDNNSQKMDIELLFNAVLSNSTKISEILRK
jgi:ABC-2 type transport system ATP-binding protein